MVKFYTFLNQMRIGKNICHKDDRMTSLYLVGGCVDSEEYQKHMEFQTNKTWVQSFKALIFFFFLVFGDIQASNNVWTFSSSIDTSVKLWRENYDSCSKTSHKGGSQEVHSK